MGSSILSQPHMPRQGLGERELRGVSNTPRPHQAEVQQRGLRAPGGPAARCSHLQPLAGRLHLLCSISLLGGHPELMGILILQKGDERKPCTRPA